MTAQQLRTRVDFRLQAVGCRLYAVTDHRPQASIRRKSRFVKSMQNKADSKLPKVLETWKMQQLMPPLQIDTPTQPATEAFRLLRRRLYLISEVSPLPRTACGSSSHGGNLLSPPTTSGLFLGERSREWLSFLTLQPNDGFSQRWPSDGSGCAGADNIRHPAAEDVLRDVSHLKPPRHDPTLLDGREPIYTLMVMWRIAGEGVHHPYFHLQRNTRTGCTSFFVAPHPPRPHSTQGQSFDPNKWWFRERNEQIKSTKTGTAERFLRLSHR